MVLLYAFRIAIVLYMLVLVAIASSHICVQGCNLKSGATWWSSYAFIFVLLMKSYTKGACIMYIVMDTAQAVMIYFYILLFKMQNQVHCVSYRVLHGGSC